MMEFPKSCRILLTLGAALAMMPAALASRAHHPGSHAAAHPVTAHRAAARTSAHAAAAHGRSRPAARPAARRGASRVRAASAHGRQARVTSRHGRAVHRYYERFTADSFNPDVTIGDNTAGENPIVRAAAIQALGGFNGTALAIDPSSGRILAMVNQKLALSAGAEPCSTIKLSVALSALSEGIVTRDTRVNLGGSYAVTMTDALARSNNLYFETLGRALGFERVKHYANEFGLGELAGWNIAGETLGTYPETVLPEKLGGVGRMCSFGESISMTPLQLGAMVAAIANGGTLYYLQHPTTPDEIANFKPKVKRLLNIAPIVPEMLDGMRGAVTYGTARSLKANFTAFPVFGKTGTCSNNGTRYGWFASYAETPAGRIVTVVFLEGGRPVFGPKAAELTGAFYRAMYERSYFGAPTIPQPAVQPSTAAQAGEEGAGGDR